ncbi:uncharacterized protein LOC116797670 [Chiroxiphia lanceolata]|uniref:uncharacterized protein LOC116797670 n=1 Tax=Chiroxiphia lanceolata TaxID=296741 RepID=UPI0013CF1CDD|nr:uncharacterized protein LOC116797670 [Chiroxiphia lanceolata]
MGSCLSKQMCCVVCGRCREQEAEGAHGETSETKPILQISGEPPMFTDTQPPTPALKVPRSGSKDVQSLGQARRPPADTLEENTETCSAADPVGRAEGWEAAWNPMDFFVAPADEEIEVEVTDLTQAEGQQEAVGHPGERMEAVPCVPEAQPVGDTARGAELVAGEEQPQEQAEPGSEGALCAGITLLERNILSLIEIGSETVPGQGCEMEPPADIGEVSIGRDLSLCAGQVAEETEPYMEGMDRAKLAQINPHSAQAQLTCLVEALSALTVQTPSEATASGMAGLCSASPESWGSLCPEWGSLEPANQLPEFSEQETQCGVPSAQGMESLHCAGLGELLPQSSHGELWELEDEGSRECDAETVAGEAELQHRIVQQTVELPEEAETCVPVPVQQEAEFPNVPLLLSEVLGSSEEIQGESVEA